MSWKETETCLHEGDDLSWHFLGVVFDALKGHAPLIPIAILLNELVDAITRPETTRSREGGL